jgi:hypothetical protein
VTSVPKPYSTPGQLKLASERLRRLGKRCAALNGREKELLFKSADVLEKLGRDHDVLVRTSITLEPK